ncbi:MAG: hypothetical protein HKN63_04115 [Rhodobacteraceae bacterium]|nr:hypothetical protein [Paracoccaceae bacterium]
MARHTSETWAFSARTVLAAALAGALFATAPRAEPTLCPAPDPAAVAAISVDAPDPALVERICRVAQTAVEELAACNVVVARPVTIRINDDLPPGCVGQYHCGEGLIEVLSPEFLKERELYDSAFHQLDPKAYFDSIITHELTHAAYDNTFCPFGTCPVTAEFLAYSMQVRSLSEADRLRFLDGMPRTRVETPADLALVLMMAPGKFAQLAWEFYSRPGKGCDYVGKVMAGDVLLDFYLP